MTATDSETRAGRVLLLHGIGRSPASMVKIERAVAASGFQTLNRAHPSRTLPLVQLSPEVRRCADVFTERPTSAPYVTHSMGVQVAHTLIA
jgi:hypothetical protein